MEISDIFLNRAGRLRSGWRLAIFCLTFSVVAFLISGGVYVTLTLLLGRAVRNQYLQSNWGFIVQSAILFSTALIAGWACGKLLEDVPLGALGWARHRGWWRDWLMGSWLGAASLILAAAIAAACGGFHFRFAATGMWLAIVQTLFVSAMIYVIGAASEETIFRGYPLQTLMRSWPFLLAALPSSLYFAKVHLNNPNVAYAFTLFDIKIGFTLINTALAGVWLAVGYLRTRSLWFPLGLHWCWNWTMGSVLGLPVSGIERLSPVPLLRATDVGPAWLTGGAYGIEGGAACTLALLLSTLFIWRTRLLTAIPEMKRWTEGENERGKEQGEGGEAKSYAENSSELV